MNPVRKQRLFIALFLLVAVSGTAGALMLALQQDINMFYPPSEIVSGGAPSEQRIRAGGMVLEGSVQRASDSLAVEFIVTDRAAAEFAVRYTGILPDLFREGQGIVVQGRLDPSGVFYADEVLAKHDENYMPPELMDMAAEAKSAKQAQGAIEAQDLKVNPASDVYRPAAESQATVSGDYSDGGGR